jgi:hypothetical protein
LGTPPPFQRAWPWGEEKGTVLRLSVGAEESGWPEVPRLKELAAGAYLGIGAPFCPWKPACRWKLWGAAAGGRWKLRGVAAGAR